MMMMMISKQAINNEIIIV